MIEKYIKNEDSLKKWRRFKGHRFAVISVWAMLLAVFFSLTAEFWANNRPLYMKYKGQSYFPVFKTYHPDKAVLFAADIQHALNYDGLDLNENETYKTLIKKYEIPESDFLAKLDNEEYRQLAYYDVALSRQLQVTGYPAAFIKTAELEFFMIAKGYANLETMELRIQNVIKEAGLGVS